MTGTISVQHSQSKIILCQMSQYFVIFYEQSHECFICYSYIILNLNSQNELELLNKLSSTDFMQKSALIALQIMLSVFKKLTIIDTALSDILQPADNAGKTHASN